MGDLHEMALAEGILAVALDAADAQPVQRIRLRVGTLQRVVPDSLEFSFQLLADGTPAAGAHLEIKHVPARVRCRRCGAKTRVESVLLGCRRCGAPEIQILSGEELLVDAVEVECGWRYRPRPATPSVSRNHLLDHVVADVGQSNGWDPQWGPA
jgi:hydrogenase nickel incorporation protein HypA/HybF